MFKRWGPYFLSLAGLMVSMWTTIGIDGAVVVGFLGSTLAALSPHLRRYLAMHPEPLRPDNGEIWRLYGGSRGN